MIIEKITTLSAIQSSYKIPSYASTVPAGFPSPADDYLENRIDLNDLIIRHPAATFFVKVKGDSMIGAGIFDGDTLVVDRSLDAVNQSVVVVVLNGEFTVKRLNKSFHRVFLMPENPEYSNIQITDGDEFEIWGVVTNVIHKLI